MLYGMNLPAQHMSFALHRLNTSAFVGRLSLHPLDDQRCSTSACTSRTPAQHRCRPHGRLQRFVSADAHCWAVATSKPSRRSQRHEQRAALFGPCKGRQRHVPSRRLPAALARADTGNAPAGRPGLSNLCRSIQQGFFELCIQNNSRPAAAALADIVAAALAAYQAAYTSDQLRLELEHGVHCAVDAAGYRLTAGEQWYRAQWLDTVYMTMQVLAGLREGDAALEAARALRPWRPDDQGLLSTVERTVQGYLNQDPRTSVQLDRALATAGLSGGAATEAETIAAQFVPISQVVLLTLRTLDQQNLAAL